MPKLSEAKVGDKVTLTGELVQLYADMVKIEFVGMNTLCILGSRECDSIIPKPHTWAVGDKFRWKASPDGKVYTIQGLFNGRMFISWDEDTYKPSSDTFVFKPELYVLCVD